jgi:aspartate carbamoyltransferase catalytic subunit
MSDASMASTPHFTSLDAMDADALGRLLDRADALHEATASGDRAPTVLDGLTVANLFYEPSTRTRTSFELAARRMGADVLNLDIAHSSTVKGETLLDTVRTLHAMRVDIFVIRHGGQGVLANLAMQLDGSRLALVSAGEGRDGHPTQALIDLLALRRRFSTLDGLEIAVIGDISHSRVAHSVIPALMTLGARVRIAGPGMFMPLADALPGAVRHTELTDALGGVQAVMALRVQRERVKEASAPDDDAYFRDWGLTESRIAATAPEAVVLHPGPFNRGVEIDSAVADGRRSLILDQVALGVPVRMAVLELMSEALTNG